MKKCKCIKDYNSFRIGDICEFNSCEDFWGGYYFVKSIGYKDNLTTNLFKEHFEILH
jgi:hypothetical protein